MRPENASDRFAMRSALHPGRWVVALAVAALCGGAGADDTPQTVTLSQALELVETENPDTLAARLQIAQAEAERLAARLYPNPSFSYDASNIPAGRTTPPGLSVGRTIGTTLRLDQPLVLWGKRGLRIAGAEAGIASAKEQAREVLRQLRAAVKDAFFDALHDERQLAFALENQRRYQDIVGLNERRFQSGDIAEAEFRKIQLEQLKYAAQVEVTRRGLAESQQLLGRLLGAAEPRAASGHLAPPPAVDIPAGDLVGAALANRPDWAALQRERERADLALRLTKRERWPDVTIGADYTHSEFVVAGDNRNTVGFGFSVPLPVLNQNQGEIAAAEVALRQADTELARRRLDIAQQVRTAVSAYESAQRLRQTFESGYIERAEITAEAAEASYRVGAASLIELLDAERTYTTTQNDYLDTVAAARASLTALEKALGKDLAGE